MHAHYLCIYVCMYEQLLILYCICQALRKIKTVSKY